MTSIDTASVPGRTAGEPEEQAVAVTLDPELFLPDPAQVDGRYTVISVETVTPSRR